MDYSAARGPLATIGSRFGVVSTAASPIFAEGRLWGVVSVSDTGAGMSEEVKSRLFEPFFTTKPPGVGTGLGLSICQSIVVAHGGTLCAQSALGKGSTLTVELPASLA